MNFFQLYLPLKTKFNFFYSYNIETCKNNNEETKLEKHFHPQKENLKYYISLNIAINVPFLFWIL